MDGFLINWLATFPNFATPLLLASLGLIICERAGILNLGAEGLMSVGAMVSVMIVLNGGGVVLGLIGGVAAATLLGLLFAIAVVVFRADQVLSGLVLVALGTGITGVIGRPFVHRPIEGIEKFDAGILGDIPVVGKLLFEQDPLVYISFAIVIFGWYALMKTNWGLRLRAVGEDPATADISGVDIQMTRIVAVLLSGAICGLAGTYLALVSSQIWVEHMVAGRGWIAVALVIFARWNPLRAIFGALIFGGAESLTPRLLAIGADVPVYLMNMLPYVITLVVLLWPYLRGGAKSSAPSSLGVAFLRQDRH